MNSHAAGPDGTWRQLQDNTACTLAEAATRCPGMLIPGHSRTPHTQLAAGSKMRWITHGISGTLVLAPWCYQALLE